MTQAITKDMLIGDLVAAYPSTVEVLLSEGVHCVGCGASYHETIEEGLAGHGRTQEEIQDIISRLNDSIPKESGNEELTLTENAVKKLKVLLEEQKKVGLKISVMAGGCSGFQYGMDLVDQPASADKTITIEGIQVFIDQESEEMLKGAKIDYLDSLQGAGFKISNPNAVNTCGCGQSFH